MIDAVAEAKRRLRSEMRGRLAMLSPADRRQAGQAVRARLLAAEAFRAGGPALGFVAMPDEIDLLPALFEAAAAGRDILVPRWNPQAQEYEAAAIGSPAQWRTGPFGVPEPPPGAPVRSMARLDLMLVPGLAFDRTGRRLGRGKGFFDRLLAQATSARRWGIAFDQQIVDAVPIAAHDVNVHLLVTPELWLPLADADSS